MNPERFSMLEEFNKYLNGYIKRLSVFEELNKRFRIKKVLYPGSYCDVVPSLVFSNVVYIDSYKKTEKFFNSNLISNYINNHKQYNDKASIEFYLADYRLKINKLNNDFDLLLSFSSGFISIPCKKYLKKGAILLANNDHYDAARAYLDKDYNLIGVIDLSNDTYIYSQSNLGDYFKIKSGENLTIESLSSLASRPPSRSLKNFSKNSDLYIFLKVRW
jgi:hypothetical protein